jgi:hypothetical protein
MYNFIEQKVFAYDSSAYDFLAILGFKNIVLGSAKKDIRKSDKSHETIPGDGIPTYLKTMYKINTIEIDYSKKQEVNVFEEQGYAILVFPYFLKPMVDISFGQEIKKSIYYYGTEEGFDIKDESGNPTPYIDSSKRLWPYETSPIASLDFLVKQLKSEYFTSRYEVLVSEFEKQAVKSKIKCTGSRVCFYTSTFENIVGKKNVPYIISPGWLGSVYKQLDLKFSVRDCNGASFSGDGIITGSDENYISMVTGRFDFFFVLPLPSWTNADLKHHNNLIKKSNPEAKIFIKNYDWMYMNNSYMGSIKIMKEISEDIGGTKYEN